MPTLEEMLDLKARYEQAQAEKDESQMTDVVSGAIGAYANRPTYASIMLNRPNQRVDMKPFIGKSYEKPEDIADLYSKYQEAQRGRSGNLEVEKMKEDRRLLERREDQGFKEKQDKTDFEQAKYLKGMEKGKEVNTPEKMEAEARAASGKKLYTDAAEMEKVASLIESKLSQYKTALKNNDKSQAITIGRELIKPLNSPLGADAVGAEEVKRLGAMLEYQMLNLTGPGKFHGRDLEGFQTQAENASEAMRESISKNKAAAREMFSGNEPKSLAQPSQSNSKKQVDSGLLGVQKAVAAPGKPDFNKMTDAQLKEYLGK